MHCIPHAIMRTRGEPTIAHRRKDGLEVKSMYKIPIIKKTKLQKYCKKIAGFCWTKKLKNGHSKCLICKTVFKY